MSKLTDKERNDIALFRYSIISPLITGTADTASNEEFYKQAADRAYVSPSNKEVTMSWYTIRRWHNLYIANGFDGLLPNRRSDINVHRKIDDEIGSTIMYVKKEYPRLPATLVLQKLIDNGTIVDGEISLSTVNRFINENCNSPMSSGMNILKRYERRHINEVWCGDTSYGPYISEDGKKRRTYIIALIDDASRFIVGIDIFYSDNFVNLMSVIKKAVMMFGKPAIFNFDNGSNYKSTQMKLLSARMGSSINYCAVRQPVQKAKIERWFRTMKDQWMAGINYKDFKNIDELKASLMKFVQEYNTKEHSSLDGKSPQDRFFEEGYMIKRIPDDRIETIFLVEIERRVSPDNVVVIDEKQYEVESKYAGRKLTLRYSPDLSRIYSVDHETGELEEIHLLDKKANAYIKRKVKIAGNEE
mgnify:CR=1 FL=1